MTVTFKFIIEPFEPNIEKMNPFQQNIIGILQFEDIAKREKQKTECTLQHPQS